MNRKVWLSAVLILLAVVVPAAAEESELTVVRVRPALDTAQLQYVLTHERKVVFDRAMGLESEQSEIFWGVYHQFEKERERLDAKRLRLLGTYISKMNALTNDDAISLVKQSSENQQADLALRQKFFRLLSKKLNPVLAARFFQLDDLIGMTVRLAILGNVPLISGLTPETSPPADPPTGADQPAPSGTASQ